MKQFKDADYYLDDCGIAIEYDEANKLLDAGLPVTAVFSYCLIDGAQGINIPNIFFKNFDLNEWHVDRSKYNALDDPYHDQYWAAWDDLLDNAYLFDDGDKFKLEQDDSLFARLYIDFN